MESTVKTNEQVITADDVKDLLLQFYSKQENMNLIDYYSRTTFFDLIKKSRSETVHSAFLAWILDGSDFPNKGISSNLMHFLQLLASRKKSKQDGSDFDDKLYDAICTGTLELNDISIETEKPVQDFDYNANSKDRLDIYISCNTNLSKQLEIFIENKVGSKEGGPHEAGSKIGESLEVVSQEGESSKEKIINDYNVYSQTIRYYSVCHDESLEKIQLFVFLSAISKSKLDDFSNFSEKDGKCKCENFIQICYQDVLERVLLPIKTLPNISSRTYNMIEEYISCLGIPAIDDDNNTSVKNQIIMAIPEVERERLRDFFQKNTILLEKTLDVVALNKVYHSKKNEKWENIVDVFKDCFNYLLNEKIITEELIIDNYTIIKKVGKKTQYNKKGDLIINDTTNMARTDLRGKLIEHLNNSPYSLGIEKISPKIQSLLYSFWERNQTLILVALKVLSDDKGNKKDNIEIDYEECYKKLTSRDLSKFSIGDRENLGKTDVVVEFVKHLIDNNYKNDENPCKSISEYFWDVSKGPTGNGIMLNSDDYIEIKKSDQIKNENKEKKQKLASDRFRDITIEGVTYYISTQWGGQYNSTIKTDNFPKLWKKIKEYNNDDENKNKFNVEPTI